MALTFDAPSRLYAVRYKLALVAFTDVVKDAKDGQEYTEVKMKGFPEAATGDIEKRMNGE